MKKARELAAEQAEVRRRMFQGYLAILPDVPEEEVAPKKKWENVLFKGAPPEEEETPPPAVTKQETAPKKPTLQVNVAPRERSFAGVLAPTPRRRNVGGRVRGRSLSSFHRRRERKVGEKSHVQGGKAELAAVKESVHVPIATVDDGSRRLGGRPMKGFL